MLLYFTPLVNFRQFYRIISCSLHNRQFITRAELIAVDDNLCNKGDHVTLILFSDCVEVLFSYLSSL